MKSYLRMAIIFLGILAKLRHNDCDKKNSVLICSVSNTDKTDIGGIIQKAAEHLHIEINLIANSQTQYKIENADGYRIIRSGRQWQLRLLNEYMDNDPANNIDTIVPDNNIIQEKKVIDTSCFAMELPKDTKERIIIIQDRKFSLVNKKKLSMTGARHDFVHPYSLKEAKSYAKYHGDMIIYRHSYNKEYCVSLASKISDCTIRWSELAEIYFVDATFNIYELKEIENILAQKKRIEDNKEGIEAKPVTRGNNCDDFYLYTKQLITEVQSKELAVEFIQERYNKNEFDWQWNYINIYKIDISPIRLIKIEKTEEGTWQITEYRYLMPAIEYATPKGYPELPTKENEVKSDIQITDSGMIIIPEDASDVARVMIGMYNQRVEMSKNPYLADCPNNIPTRFILKDDIDSYAGKQGIIKHGEYHCNVYGINRGIYKTKYVNMTYEHEKEKWLQDRSYDFHKGAIIAIPMPYKKLLSIAKNTFSNNNEDILIEQIQLISFKYKDLADIRNSEKVDLEKAYLDHDIEGRIRNRNDYLAMEYVALKEYVELPAHTTEAQGEDMPQEVCNEVATICDSATILPQKICNGISFAKEKREVRYIKLVRKERRKAMWQCNLLCT